MTNRSFPSRVRHIQAGEPVSAGVAGRPDKALEGRTNYLKEVIDQIEAGRALILRDQAVAPEVLEGQPVYWNADNDRYEQALAAVESTDVGEFAPTVSSDCMGMVLTKKVGNTADIVLWGVVAFPSLANTIATETIQIGRYYLSQTEAGQLTYQRPPVTVPVCYVLGPKDACDTNIWVFVQPVPRNFLEDHIHYQFELTALPAGDHVPPLPGESHVITNADPMRTGWLPADDPSFDGQAPAGAKFGYNLAAHEGLNRVFPPIPVTAAVLEMYRPSATEDAPPAFYGLQRVSSEFVRIDKNGIWWMSACYNEVPWPVDLNTTLSSSSVSVSSVSVSSSSSAVETCPVPRSMQLIFSFLKMTFLTDRAVVTSLQPDEGQPFQFVNCDGVTATTGDLYARLIWSLLVEDDYAGGQVLKGITETNRFKRGWVTEGVIAGSEAVVLSSTHSRLLDPEAAAGPSNPTVHQGLVTVDVQLDPTERELLPQLVVLGDALERVYKGLTYLGFPNGRNSGIRAKFVVPYSGLPTNPKLKIRVQLFGRGTGTLTDMDASYYISVRPTIGVPTPITAGDTPLTLATNVAVSADEIHEIESAEITIAAGDTIFVSLERDANGSPTYDYEIGLVRIGAILVAGS